MSLHSPLRPTITLAALLALGCGGGDAPSQADRLGLVLTPTTVTLAEGGTSRALLVSLDRAPDSSVTIDLSDYGRLGFSRSSVTFTPENFATVQTVSLTPFTDNNTVADRDTVFLSFDGAVVGKVPALITDKGPDATH